MMDAMDAVEALLNEVRLTFHRAVQVAEELHAAEPITVGQRAILEYLRRSVPSAVPAIARARLVTRQHVQVLVNGLLDEGLVELRPNPVHLRSSLVALTPAGERAIGRMKKREAQRLSRTVLGATRAEIERATRTLRAVREALGGKP